MDNSAKIKKLAFGVFALLRLAAEAHLLRHQIVDVITPAVETISNIGYYENGATTWNITTWLGVPLEKYPTDLLVYQEIIFETKPDVIIEAGTYKGGSAYYFATLFDLLGSFPGASTAS